MDAAPGTAWVGCRERVAAGGGLAEARADDDQEVRALDGSRQPRLGADARAAHVAAVAVVEVILVAERRRHRQVEAVRERLDRRLHLPAPAGTADDHQGPLGTLKPVPQLGHGCRARLHFRHSRGLGVDGLRRRRQHVLGKAEHDGARAARARGMEGVAHVLDALV
jgi:hypothetical protein